MGPEKEFSSCRIFAAILALIETAAGENPSLETTLDLETTKQDRKYFEIEARAGKHVLSNFIKQNRDDISGLLTTYKRTHLGY